MSRRARSLWFVALYLLWALVLAVLAARGFLPPPVPPGRLKKLDGGKSPAGVRSVQGAGILGHAGTAAVLWPVRIEVWCTRRAEVLGEN
jgi:hypothetical protein